MKLDEWVKEARSELELFEEFWRHCHPDAPDDFPLEMKAGDWDEQFIGYMALRRPPEDPANPAPE